MPVDLPALCAVAWQLWLLQESVGQFSNFPINTFMPRASLTCYQFQWPNKILMKTVCLYFREGGLIPSASCITFRKSQFQGGFLKGKFFISPAKPSVFSHLGVVSEWTYILSSEVGLLVLLAESMGGKTLTQTFAPWRYEMVWCELKKMTYGVGSYWIRLWSFKVIGSYWSAKSWQHNMDFGVLVTEWWAGVSICELVRFFFFLM